MSTPPAPPTPPPADQQPPPGTIACPRCGSAIGPDQDWCVTCGVAARTRVAPVPNWRRPISVVSAVGALALATVAVALVSLSTSSAPPGNATITAVTGPPISTATVPAAAAVPPAATPGSTIGTPTTIKPATTTPPATTTSPTATTPTTTTTPRSTGGAATRQ